eukprot:7375949-Prymnesium_polylepis.2
MMRQLFGSGLPSRMCTRWSRPRNPEREGMAGMPVDPSRQLRCCTFPQLCNSYKVAPSDAIGQP